MSLDRNCVPHWRPGFRFQFEPAQNVHVLLYPEGMIRFNESASAISALIDGARTVADIVAHLERQFPDVPELGGDVDAFMETACAEHWIELA
ncbi:pyrroloquinoline quinone biosynthesis peptide chaperone PqqD [Burkholderia multivorans]|uniref:pyrroloquinoline quinone biosynthesis peptide chaperone PqqD n=1 Tax=Burkholderia TaxID=32008 RepID=UPI000D007CB2|nr:pyrroloquinoline quinone biosynthesis peptide chaperone PqqD [Burkholderia multivorans]MBU9160134.1 pyrroloquinoline quinone biosynthesis peptide chaperone PqqD [Burkholderia multivorans]MBU9261129.1 pyrroloquinoline quinone biosynthesis peptide chaperone PqqD [Burkholderia multivorans]MBU9487027.1 pyrroloquinoline quinone biosynthesis peptide chaperone PqqD [Burkholderia multivorans]MBU9541400.1 pyrroloquinoline quinone biosynthesis peptide chaperone PqqD [Burkholderia multivorans]MCA81735